MFKAKNLSMFLFAYFKTLVCPKLFMEPKPLHKKLSKNEVKMLLGAISGLTNRC